MRQWRWLGSLVVVLIAASAAAQSRDISVEAMRSEKRVALVIGNGAYATSPLRNPANDARAMARTLKSLGFDVIARENVGEKAMRQAILDFGDRLQGGGVGLFFYAGHGMQVAGRNFLVPIGANIRAERDVELEAIDVARVLARMEEAKNRLNIVVLDACRDNPFARSFRSASRGLAQIDAPTGTLIAYATSPGKLARDGDGSNGLFTGELLRAMREPGLKLEDVFKRVRQAVRQKTNGEQVPWEASSVEGEFVFALKAGSQISAIPAPPEPPKKIDVEATRRQEEERQLQLNKVRGAWTVRDSGHEEKPGYSQRFTRIFKERFPGGKDLYHLKLALALRVEGTSVDGYMQLDVGWILAMQVGDKDRIPKACQFENPYPGLSVITVNVAGKARSSVQGSVSEGGVVRLTKNPGDLLVSPCYEQYKQPLEKWASETSSFRVRLSPDGSSLTLDVPEGEFALSRGQ